MAHLEAQGTERVLTVHTMPQHNRVTEQLNGVLAKKVCTILYNSRLSHFLWREVVNYTTWLKNHTLTKALKGKTPFEAVHGNLLNLAWLPTWGTAHGSMMWIHQK